MAERQVGLQDRIGALAPDLTVDDSMTVEYTWHRGYERLVIEGDHVGTLEYAGSYHPDGMCEGRGICKWCGITLFD